MPSVEQSCVELFRLLGVDVDPGTRKALMSLALSHIYADRRAVLEAAAEVVCGACADGVPLDGEIHRTSRGSLSCGAAEIRKLAEEL